MSTVKSSKMGKVGHGGDARFNTTLAEMTFYTYDSGQVVVGVNHSAGKLFPGDVVHAEHSGSAIVGNLTQFTVQKQLGAACGTWQATFKPLLHGTVRVNGKPIADVVGEADWCRIVVWKNGVFGLLLVGRVDTQVLNISASQTGVPNVTLSLTGRDVGAAVEDTPLYFNPYDGLHSNAAGIGMAKLLGSEFQVSGRPDEIVPDLLLGVAGSDDALFGHPPKVPAGVFSVLEEQWVAGIDGKSRVERVRGFTHSPHMLQVGEFTPLWAFASQYANLAMNEMWFDVDVDDQGKLFGHTAFLNFREKPFVNLMDTAHSPWFFLPTHEISLDSVVSLSLGRGKGRVNHIQVLGEVPSSFGGDAMVLFQPIFDEQSIAKYGLRRLPPVRTPYMAESDGGGAAAFGETEMGQWRELILSWNALNARYWQGMITLAEMRPEIRVGQKVVLLDGPPANYPGFPSDGGVHALAMTFYVEGVQHVWSAGQQPQAQTQVLVSRGYVEKDRIPDMTTAAAGFKLIVGSASSSNEGKSDDVPEGDVDGET